MKKLMMMVGVACAAFAACADTVYTTNVVVVVSNIYNRISTEHWITNNVKNTHANYFETNHVYTIDHQTLVVERTNTTVNVDVSLQAIDAARAQADRAEDAVDDARGFASSAAGSASSAAGSASSASSYANQAASQRSAAASECAAALQTINDRIAWFDEHSGETITVNNYNWTTNIYYAEDSVARAGVAQNAADIASLESRVGDNIQQLTTRMGTAETNIGNLNTSVSGLTTRMGTAETNIGNLNTSVSGLTTRMGTAERGIAASVAYTTAVSNKLEVSVSGLTTRMGTAETNIGNLNTSVSGLTTRMGTAETNIGNLNTSVSGLTTRMGTAENDIRNLKTYSDILRKQVGYIPDRFVYTVKKDGVYIGDLIVNVSKRSVVASNDTTRTFNFEYSTTWPVASNPRITSLTKTVPRVGKSATPSCNLVISFMSSEYQVNLTGLPVDSNELSFIYSGWSLQATDHACTFEFARVEGIEIANIMGSFFGSSKYKSPGGVVYDRIDVYTTPTNGNKVAAYATGQASASGFTVVGASLGYTVHFSSSWVTNPNVDANCWQVMPAFTEFVGGVLKLHFVPTVRKAISAKTGTVDAGCVYLLEDFYWSDGCIYCVVASYRDGVFRGRIRCKFVDGTYLSYPYVKVSFPDSICSQLSAGTYSADMEFDSREGEIMGTGSTAGFVRFKTIKGSVAAKDSPVVFPENPSMTDMINMMWYNTYGQ